MKYHVLVGSKTRKERKEKREFFVCSGFDMQQHVERIERNIFAAAQTHRPSRRRVQNRFSREEAGTCGSHVVVFRNVGFTTIREPLGKKNGVMQYREYKVRNYGSQVCKSINQY